MADSSLRESTINAMEESFHDDATERLCAKCGKEFKSRSGLRRHMLRHEKTYKYECSHCDRKFLEKHQYLGHLRKDHEKEKLACDRCGKEFNYKQSIIRHRKSCAMKERHVFKCTYCELKFDRRDVLWDHVNGVHENIRRFQCAICSKDYKWRSSLSHHMTRKHSKKPTYDRP